MKMSNEQMHWMVKVFQPERTVASLPGAVSLTQQARAALLGLDPDYYSTELAKLTAGAKTSARMLLTEPDVCAMIDRLPLRKNARVFAFGDSRTSDPQSWAVILQELILVRRPSDNISVVASAVSGDTTTHGLVRISEVLAGSPDWVLFFLGLNDARTQGTEPTKTIVHHEETARNLIELRSRVMSETEARCLWITPAAVNESQVARHWALSHFGVRFRNEDIAQVARAMRSLGDPVVDLFQGLDASSLNELLMEDGLHFTQAGQQRVALEIVRSWSEL
ncbi:SGNH/GDSL hydrolase family protein [Rhizobium sp. BK491]|uniref:SGNH/GDSL hydrolase family protein n=1 Tax=Rhizobium sp. BK491 TaxID=2587009 RepID=UPI00184DD2B7|nr:SGNH/GDSL hydrolase family protein [Rhizobium sp. BK491]MBB3572010.1 lysophospholipase L1-like esterase [Rhizobium sp. BK491]